MMVHIQEVKNTVINVTILNENELVRPKLDQKSSFFGEKYESCLFLEKRWSITYIFLFHTKKRK